MQRSRKKSTAAAVRNKSLYEPKKKYYDGTVWAAVFMEETAVRRAAAGHEEDRGEHRIMEVQIRTMRIEDYEGVYGLWKTIHGFGLRSIDDSREGTERFLKRNPDTSIVAEWDGEIVGSILCGHDGRTGYFYHVCVDERYRNQGIGRKMATAAMRALQKEQINKVSLIAFKTNEIGNQFWHRFGWKERTDVNVYDFILNDENITRFNK